MKHKIVLFFFLSIFDCYFTQVLDNSFGINGKIVYDININQNIETISSIIKLDNGKLLVGGSDNNNAYLVKHNSNGTTDTNFQNNGVLKFQFRSISKILRKNTGEIFILGSKIGTDGYYNIVVAKIDESGNFDLSFGNNGILEINFGYQSDDSAFTGVFQPDGKIVIVGNKKGSNALTEGFVLRLLPNGQFDSTFNNSGLFTIAPVNHRHYLTAVSIYPNGNIVCSGYLLLTVGSNQARMFVFRLLPNGQLDNTFANIGYTYFNVSTSGDSLSLPHILLNDGSILLGGSSYSPNNTGVGYNFTLVKLNNNGGFDNSFGSNGIVQTLLPQTGGQIRDLKLDSSNNILAMGYTYSMTNGNENFTIMKYNQSGTIDNQFGNSGAVVTDFFGFQDIPYCSIVDNSKIILAGFATISYPPSNSNFAIAQYIYQDNMGTNEINRIKDYIIFPTIFNDAVNIKCNKEMKLNIDVFNSIGELIKKEHEFSCNQNIKSFNIPTTSKGIYLFKVGSENKITLHKLIKK